MEKRKEPKAHSTNNHKFNSLQPAFAISTISKFQKKRKKLKAQLTYHPKFNGSKPPDATGNMSKKEKKMKPIKHKGLSLMV